MRYGPTGATGGQMAASPHNRSGETEPIYVVAGKDQPLVNATLGKLLDELIEPSERTTCLLDVNGRDVQACEVLDELRTLPFLARRRVVVVRGADEFVSRNRELLENYFAAPCTTGVLVLVVESWRGNTRLAKILARCGRLLNVVPPKGNALSGHLAEYARQSYGKRLAKGVVEALLELSGEELPRLYSEIDKLAVYADTEQLITLEHVESLTGYNRMFGAFEVIDAVIAGRAGQALDRLRRMFNDDRTAEYRIVGAFSFHLRRMFAAKSRLARGEQPQKIAREMKIWRNKQRFFAQLQELSLRQIGQYLQRLGRTDYEIKTGRTRTPVAMEQFVLELCRS